MSMSGVAEVTRQNVSVLLDNSAVVNFDTIFIRLEILFETIVVCGNCITRTLYPVFYNE